MAVRLRAFLAFWYDFVVGDDWLVAVGVAAGLALTYLLSRAAVPAWWLLPLCLLVLLPLSLWRAVRQHSAGPHSAGPHSAGPHSAGPDSAGPDSAGQHPAGQHSASQH